MENVNAKIAEWSKMGFTQNPYGPSIPAVYLYNSAVMNDSEKNMNLAKCMQNGNVMDVIFNDTSKTSPAEKEETISFSAIYHRLDEAGTLCPSNYILNVITDLQKYDEEHEVVHDRDFYCKTIARSLRSFASYLREDNLREIVDRYMKTEAIRRGQNYIMFEASVEEDLHAKTDIKIQYGKKIYRIWSYQSTKTGIRKTSRRILRGAGSGLNLLMPIDIAKSNKNRGWALYNESEVHDILKDLVINRKGFAEHYNAYKAKVEEDKRIVAKPCVFYAA